MFIGLGLWEKSTGNHRFSHEIRGFPVIFPINQSNDGWFSHEAIGHYRHPGVVSFAEFQCASAGSACEARGERDVRSGFCQLGIVCVCAQYIYIYLYNPTFAIEHDHLVIEFLGNQQFAKLLRSSILFGKPTVCDRK